MPNTQSDEIRMKSRWIDVEKTVKMLSATSCPASTIKKMTDISVHSSIANKIDYKLRPATVKEVRRNLKRPRIITALTKTHLPPSPPILSPTEHKITKVRQIRRAPLQPSTISSHPHPHNNLLKRRMPVDTYKPPSRQPSRNSHKVRRLSTLNITMPCLN